MNPRETASIVPVTSARKRCPPAWRMARSLAKDLGKRAVVSAGRGLNRCLGSRAGQSTGILMYHRMVDPISHVDPPTWNIAPAAFRAQMLGLLDRGFRAWPLRRVLSCHHRGEPVPAKTFVVTFDDGQESVYQHAWPILKELRIPATLFLSTAYIDSQQALPFDDWPVAGCDSVPRESWRPVSTVQCRAMAAEGLVELGAHTHTHQDFSSRPRDFKCDLALNAEALRSQFGVEDATFAFPFGRATPAMMGTVRQAGFSCALTCVAIPAEPRHSPFGWGRFHVETWDTAASLATKLSGWYSWALRLGRRCSLGAPASFLRDPTS